MHVQTDGSVVREEVKGGSVGRGHGLKDQHQTVNYVQPSYRRSTVSIPSERGSGSWGSGGGDHVCSKYVSHVHRHMRSSSHLSGTDAVLDGDQLQQQEEEKSR